MNTPIQSELQYAGEQWVTLDTANSYIASLKEKWNATIDRCDSANDKRNDLMDANQALKERIAALEDALWHIRDITAIDVGHGNITAHNIARAALAATEPKEPK